MKTKNKRAISLLPLIISAILIGYFLADQLKGVVLTALTLYIYIYTLEKLKLIKIVALDQANNNKNKKEVGKI